jgi:hypothetical protein
MAQNGRVTRLPMKVGRYLRGRTYIESDKMTSSAPMESADQTAQAGGRVSTTMVVLTRPPARAV